MGDSSWIGSLNVDTFVDGLLTRAKAQLELNLSARSQNLKSDESAIRLRQQVYDSAAKLVDKLNANFDDLEKSFDPDWKINISDAAVVAATVSGTAVPGTHTLEVGELAQAESVSSKDVYADTTTALGVSETLTLGVGSGATFNVQIQGTDSLQSIVSSINNTAAANHAGITASVINTGTGYHLVISSTETGVANRVNITESGSALLNISNDGSARAGNELLVAQDARVKFDGVDIVSASNNYSVSGINLDFLKTTSSEVTLSFSQSNPVSRVSTAINTLIGNYNDLVKLLGQAEAQTAGKSRLSGMLKQLTESMAATFSGGAYSKLADIGIQQEDPHASDMQFSVMRADGQEVTCYLSGLLRVVSASSLTDGTSLADALTNNFSGVKQLLFDSNNGIFTKIHNSIHAVTGNIWKYLEGDDAGSLQRVAETDLAGIQAKQTELRDNINDTEKHLTDVYNALRASLTVMQNTSLYLSQYLEATKSK